MKAPFGAHLYTLIFLSPATYRPSGPCAMSPGLGLRCESALLPTRGRICARLAVYVCAKPHPLLVRFVGAAPQTALSCVVRPALAWRNRCHQGALSLVPVLESSPNSQHTYT